MPLPEPALYVVRRGPAYLVLVDEEYAWSHDRDDATRLTFNQALGHSRVLAARVARLEA